MSPKISPVRIESRSRLFVGPNHARDTIFCPHAYDIVISLCAEIQLSATAKLILIYGSIGNCICCNEILVLLSSFKDVQNNSTKIITIVEFIAKFKDVDS